MVQTALVTGGAGFIGSTLARRLTADGWRVTVVDALTDYYDPAAKRRNLDWAAHESLTVLERDLLDPDLDLRPLVAGADVVFHLAGQPGVRASWGEGFDVYSRANIDATQRLLEAAVGAERLTRFVYASSSSVYGDAERYPTAETDLPAPISPYGVTKLAGEHLSRLYARLHGVPTVALRFFTVYGPRQRPDMAFHRFIRAALHGEPVTLFGDGSQIREFTYVDDIVEACVRAGTTEGVAAGRLYNVSGGASVSVREVLDILRDLAGGSLTIDRLPAVPGDVFRTGGAVDRVQEELGWRPAVAIQDGLAAEWAWLSALA
ncbi:MAG: NAD-dependent epimerase/dehydratase family protein [Microbacteriaceae bacterium]|nr:NAD-dependent epimerase/dehydratase family protein [Microbacteriaceae bacterium]